MNPEEIQKHLEWVRTDQWVEMSIFQRVLYETGARFNEAKSMKMQDVREDFEIPMETKTEKEKKPISRTLAKEINRLINIKQLKAKGKRVFSTKSMPTK